MSAKHISLGEPAHDAERQGLRFLVEGLPDDYTVYSNAWLVERSGVVHELDAVVVAPHGIYVVELKAYRGTIRGTDHDWEVSPAPIRSPIKKNRHTAQVFSSELRRTSAEAGRRWVDHFVFLSHATDHHIRGDASRDRIHLRSSILAALQDVRGFNLRCPRGNCPEVDAHTRKMLDLLLTQQDTSQRPRTKIREWRILSSLERTERWQEHQVQHDLTHERALLRVYPLSPLDDADVRESLVQRLRWEAQVLQRVSVHESILKVKPVFEEPGLGLCLPLEDFPGLTLPTWIERHTASLSGREGLREKVRLWLLLVNAVKHAHSHGVVHRLLRPEVVLVEDVALEAKVKLTGFELAKQLHSDRTAHLTSLQDDRLRWAAPEVVQRFSNASPHADQWGLGVLLAWLVTGRPLFDSTVERVRRPALVPTVTTYNAHVSKSLDAAITRMLELRATDRFPTIDEAQEAVEAALEGRITTQALLQRDLNPDKIPDQTRLNSDYEVLETLGTGGLATVYRALHLVSGSHRALKVSTTAAEDSLLEEYETLSGLSHEHIVKVNDVSQTLIPGRRVMIMERVRGDTLTTWLAKHPSPDRESQRRFAEHLFSALEYLESKGITHKDLKPDNVMVGPEGLTLIDFSLAKRAPEAILAGTALYRDPSLTAWDAPADRYAAALVLHELFVGRHAFDGQVPFPEELPHLDPEDFDAPGLYRFFQRALNPNRRERFATAREMRDFFRSSLGQKSGTRGSGYTPVPANADAAAVRPDAPLGASRLSGTAVAALGRAGVHTLGELVALSASQLRAISGLGKKKREEVEAFQAELLAQGLAPVERAVPRKVLFPELEGDPTDLRTLGLSAALDLALEGAGFTSVGRLASATREDLARVGGVGDGRLAQVVEALDRFASQTRTAGVRRPTLDAVWEQASHKLEPPERRVIVATFGFHGAPVDQQGRLAQILEVSQPEVSRALNQGLKRLDRGVLEPLVDALGAHLEAAEGVLTLVEACARLEEEWLPSESLHTDGLVRLLQRLYQTRIQQHDGFETSELAVLFREPITATELDTFVQTAMELGAWRDGEPTDPAAARLALRKVMPFYRGDGVQLATRLLPDLRVSALGELFVSPLEGRDLLRYALRRARLPISVKVLLEQLHDTFGTEGILTPSEDALPSVLAELLPDYRVEDGQVVPAMTRFETAAPVQEDPLPSELQTTQKSYGEALADRLRAVAKGRGYRLLVTPPDRHPEVARSVARALQPATFISFEARLLEQMEPDFERYEAAERSLASRHRLKREAEALLDTLLREHGRSGQVVVLGDTGILGICGAEQEITKRLFNRVTERDLGFWLLAIPGYVSNRQPRFNDRTPLLNLQVERVPEALPSPAHVGAVG